MGSLICCSMIMGIILPYCLIISPSFASILDCSSEWILAGNNCYQISPVAMNWFRAQEFCWGKNAFLAEIKNEEQQRNLEEIVIQDQHLHYWIGLNDIETEVTFVWAESHDMIVFSNWGHGQPDDAQNNYNGEDCAHLRPFTWNDANCNILHLGTRPIHALCQKSVQ